MLANKVGVTNLVHMIDCLYPLTILNQKQTKDSEARLPPVVLPLLNQYMLHRYKSFIQAVCRIQ